MTKNTDTALEMYVGGLMLDPNTQTPVVVLKDESGNICLPIWIGVAEATSIASAIKQINMSRPLTHDLIYDILNEIGVKIKSIVITDLRDSTYFAELVLMHGDRALIIDSRPSDAIAIALRAAAPIYVSQKVLEQAKITFAEHQKQQQAKASESGGEQDEEQLESEVPLAPGGDLSSVDKEKWNEILSNLDPDDFKYKM
jgi:bifunctional DNase/RNase